MHRTISALVAAVAMVTASAAPAMACGGVFGGSCYAAPAPVYSACNTGCGWAHERLPDPVQQYGAVPYAGPQYYYVNQGPTYTGPGNWAPRPVYQENAVSGPVVYSHHTHRHHRHSGYAARHHGHPQHALRRYY